MPPSTEKAAAPPFQVIRRNGGVTPLDATKITVALTKAFLAVEGNSAAASRRVHEIVAELADQFVGNLSRRADNGRTFHMEDIQDQVELALMRGEHHQVARAYVLYREEHARARQSKVMMPVAEAAGSSLKVRRDDGSLAPLDDARLTALVAEACTGLEGVSVDPILAETLRNIYDGITVDEMSLAPILAARALVEAEPNYSYVSARLLLDKLRREALSYVAGAPTEASHADMATRYAEYFPGFEDRHRRRADRSGARPLRPCPHARRD